eukprot:TRINITY_DN17322_c2_g1_i1.p1 TRINITY_DN17322_c2_g1~~TRINITY_DN17322_c2_g1_i1.p1  ORF type:complete len:103 (-),score=9.23 TRINITY_DN17322_c2_g1_i1:142-450(-)
MPPTFIKIAEVLSLNVPDSLLKIPLLSIQFLKDLKHIYKARLGGALLQAISIFSLLSYVNPFQHFPVPSQSKQIEDWLSIWISGGIEMSDKQCLIPCIPKML